MLYPDTQPIPEPDYRDFPSIVTVAAASNWYFLTARVMPSMTAITPSVSLPQYQTPTALYLHVEYVKKITKTYCFYYPSFYRALKPSEDRKVPPINDYRFYISWSM